MTDYATTCRLRYSRSMGTRRHNPTIEEQALAEARAFREQSALDREIQHLRRWRELWLGRWAELSEEEREAIRGVVRGRSGLLAGKDDRSYGFLTVCLRELERQTGARQAAGGLFL